MGETARGVREHVGAIAVWGIAIRHALGERRRDPNADPFDRTPVAQAIPEPMRPPTRKRQAAGA